jgi:hypothetical protein
MTVVCSKAKQTQAKPMLNAMPYSKPQHLNIEEAPAHTPQPTRTLPVARQSFLVFCKIVFIISLPTFVASANLGAKNVCVFSNLSFQLSKSPNSTHSLHPLAANVNSRSSDRKVLSSIAVLMTSSSNLLLRKRYSVTPSQRRKRGVLQIMWSYGMILRRAQQSTMASSERWLLGVGVSGFLPKENLSRTSSRSSKSSFELLFR